MMRSLWSGVSGLKVHQTKMDVIGNNIANVNTVGFRSSTVNFSDVYYQTTKSASGPNVDTGTAGTNAMQIGLGSNVAAISVNLSGTGATNRTDRGMDVMINGDAFFVVDNMGTTCFTKSGALDIDANGMLYCTTNGASVLGWGVDAEGKIRKDMVSTLTLMSPENETAAPSATRNVTLAGNIDKKDPDVAYNVGPVVGEDGTPTDQVQFLSDGYPISVKFFDNIGNSYTAKLGVMQVDDQTDNKYTVRILDVLDKNGSILKEAYDDNGVTKYKKVNAVVNEDGTINEEGAGQYLKLAGKEITYTVDQVTGELTFSTPEGGDPQLWFNGYSGEFVGVGNVPADGGDDATVTGAALNLALNNAENPNTDSPFPIAGVEIDFSGLTMYGGSKSSKVEAKRGDRTGANGGNAPGALNGFTINTEGKIYAVYDNGDNKLLGQLAFATFPNPSGLEALGNGLYAATLNSGEFDGIGKEITSCGSLSVGALEMSDVDLATEFTNMITTQRGFQANSRTITTSDSMLEELINLKR